MHQNLTATSPQLAPLGNASLRATHIDWRGLAAAWLFFWYFSGVTHILLLASGATGFFPLRQGIIVSTLWLIPMLLFPARGRAIAGGVGLVAFLALVGLLSITEVQMVHRTLTARLRRRPPQGERP